MTEPWEMEEGWGKGKQKLHFLIQVVVKLKPHFCRKREKAKSRLAERD